MIDFVLLGYFSVMALVLLGIGVFSRIPFLAVAGGVILVMIGIIFMTNNGISLQHCEFNTNTTAIDCIYQNMTYPTDMFNELVGGVLMLIGAGSVVAVII